MRQRTDALLAGGLAEGMNPRDFDPEALRVGTKIEMEHTRLPGVARRIAMDHIVEHGPEYYVELPKMEAELERRHAMKANVDWSEVGKKVVLPLSGSMQRNPAMGGWAVLGIAAAAASAYHGYKRNEARNPVAWALWWALWGGVIPIVTIPIALAQGFGRPAGAA